MKIQQVKEDNFALSIERTLDNTLNFEQSSILDKYVSDDASQGDSSVLGLYRFSSVILDSVVPYLKQVSSYTQYTDEEEKLYRNKPMKLSLDTYGVTDFWYIILAVNGYMSPSEFKNFKTLLIPSKTVIESTVNSILFNNSDIGIANIN